MCNCKRTTWAEAFNNNAVFVILGAIFFMTSIGAIVQDYLSQKGCP